MKTTYLVRFCVCLLVLAIWLPCCMAAKTEQPPNVLLLIGDDMTWRDCGAYGNDEVGTPNIDKLASQGICFDRMFTSTAMCSPTRQQLYTGVWPVRNGAYPNHSGVYDGVKSIVHHLKALGYRVGLNGKSHVKPRASFPFENVGGAKGVAEFINRDAKQPYCLIVASHSPHSPWTEGNAKQYDPTKLTVPPYLIDTAKTREELTHYYAEITALDAELGHLMKLVEDSGRRDNTLLLFTSEQGSSMPFGGKWTCYDTGLKTAFIARWPGRVEPGSRTEALTQYVDVVPTLIELAGGDPSRADVGIGGSPEGGRGFDGRSFANVLLGKSDDHRDYVYGAHTTRGIIRGSESYPIRSVRDHRYKYIRNLSHEAHFSGVMLGEGGIYASWQIAARANPELTARVKLIVTRPREELYDLETDPFELHNLADDPAMRDIGHKLAKELERWMNQQGDQGVATEMKAKLRQGSRGKK